MAIQIDRTGRRRERIYVASPPAVTTPSPTFSVALCTYNGARYIREQIQSIIDQTRPPCELVVGDDRSSDATLDIVTSILAPFPIRVLTSTGKRLGPTANFSRTAMSCTGDVIAFSDQDDVWAANKLARFAEAFVYPEIGSCYCDASLVDSGGRALGRTLWQAAGFDPDDFHPVRWFIRRTIAFGMSMAIRSDLRDRVFPIPARWGHDNWTAIVAAGLADVALFNEPLVNYRQHGNQVAGAKNRWRKPTGVVATITPDAEAYERLAERLESIASTTIDPHGLKWLHAHVAAKAEHLRTRESLPTGVTERLRTVAEDLINGEYHSHSNGVRSAIRDLVTGGRGR